MVRQRGRFLEGLARLAGYVLTPGDLAVLVTIDQRCEHGEFAGSYVVEANT